MTRALEPPTREEITAAADRIRGTVTRTPLVPLALRGVEGEIFLKLENLQPYGSFKLRPATNAVKSLSDEEAREGILTPSTGNFGQGLAAAAARLGVPCTVIVPDTAAKTKIAALEAAIVTEAPDRA